MISLLITRLFFLKASVAGDFVVHRVTTWEIERDEFKSYLGNPEVVMIDVWEEREFNGATPYGELRAGYIPGAIYFYYRDLLDENGTVLPRTAILKKLQEHGVSPDAQILVYCTAGVRAGWFTSVLTNAGLTDRNYAGSMLEWTSFPANDYPLVSRDR